MADHIEYYKGKVILFTGGAGAIGSNLCKALLKTGAESITILDDFSSGFSWNVPDNIFTLKGSVTDEDCLKRAFIKKPQVVFHLAALFANQNSVDYPEKDLMVNGLGTLKVLEFCRLYGIEKFIYASSVYGNNGALPLKEESATLDPSTPYQITKMLGELYCNFFYNYYGLPAVRVCFFNSYGPGEVPGQYRNVIPNFIYRAMKGEALPITGTGQETRDFTYVGDLIDGLLRAGYSDAAIGEKFNIASGKETKIIDLANMINELTGNRAGVKFVSKRRWDTKDKRLASIEKAGLILGYEPKVSLNDGLKETIKWFKDNWRLIEESAFFTPERIVKS